MGYKITKDNIHTSPEEKKWSLVGKEVDYNQGMHRFRVLDDDKNVYFSGVSDDDSDFSPLDDYQYAYGCTEIQYKDKKTNKYVTL
ncbi:MULTISPECIES: hypothetical protein [Bacillus cereus group]|uniref:Uncharacterized protein n=3 Tax=Bacillus cereus group TaxID=86661 RepID=A0A090Y8M0_9BACI|nr:MULTISPECIES: hypothetical protein [Bacillus cereus group]EJR94933.1 hypothetical protein IKO_05834 [Bacillus cereus VDM034]HDR7949948.1 hypothetical protein [Bacillus toyonensis]AOM14603.1 hypothetical protein BTI247_62730 [Bacillus thuringiensis Bt18247]EJR92671.1 hypothetical protein IKM_06190 [Bacillus mycoides]KFM94834.1 hypothetical protein DJ93_6004 [Bacillus clarus]